MAMQQSTKVGISMSRKRGEIVIFRSTIEALDNPKYIRILYNRKDKKLAIQALQQPVIDGFIVPKDTTGRWAFVICSQFFLNMVWFENPYEIDASYRIYGELHKEFHLIEFNLKDALLMMEGLEIVGEVIPMESVIPNSNWYIEEKDMENGI